MAAIDDDISDQISWPPSPVPSMASVAASQPSQPLPNRAKKTPDQCLREHWNDELDLQWLNIANDHRDQHLIGGKLTKPLWLVVSAEMKDKYGINRPWKKYSNRFIQLRSRWLIYHHLLGLSGWSSDQDGRILASEKAWNEKLKVSMGIPL